MAPSTSADLLQAAVSEPGILSQAYRQFHTYSLGNQLLAWGQCLEREIQPGPINTFPGWKSLGRWVKRGEKAITLCMPITVKRRQSDPDPDEPDQMFTRFIYKPRWFVLSQTEGQELPEPEIPSWDADHALERLNIKEIEFDHLDGNCLGFARDRSIAINTVNPLEAQDQFP